MNTTGIKKSRVREEKLVELTQREEERWKGWWVVGGRGVGPTDRQRKKASN